MPVTEAYTALERGVVDGTVLPWEGMHVFKQAELLKYSTEADFYTMTMMVVMNKNSYNSLPDDLKKVIDETTGMVMSNEAGKIYDEVRPIMKQNCEKAGVQPLELPAPVREKLEQLTVPLREEWVKEMEEKNLPGRKILDTALELINE
jgi:TRAP-type C4-dicarboxylate transport system substrate-binding protein